MSTISSVKLLHGLYFLKIMLLAVADSIYNTKCNIKSIENITL